MDTSVIEHLKNIRNTDQDLLDYFNERYIAKLEQIQDLKTEQFERKVKMDELTKTLDVYSFKNSTGHNVFSPFSTTTTSQEEKAAQIEQDLQGLNEEYQTLNVQIHTLETEAEALKKWITSIHQAVKNLDSLQAEAAEELKAAAEAAAVEAESEPEEAVPSMEAILRAERRLLSDRITSELKPELSGICHKLELLSWLMKSDVNRASITLTELNESAADLTKLLDALIYDLSEDAFGTETMKGQLES